MVVVRFLVGQDEERALVRLNQKLAANATRLPPGASAPLVQARSIDDVPVMALTLWGAGYDDVQLRQMAGQLQEALKELPDISEITIIGGRPRRVTVDLDPAALSARHLDPLVGAAGAGPQPTFARRRGEHRFTTTGRHRIETGDWLSIARRRRNRVVVGMADGTPVSSRGRGVGHGRRR